MKPSIIFDIDGTLADNSHRLHYIDPNLHKRDWQAYNANMHLDEPIEANCRLLRACAMAYPIILMTGREEQYMKETASWLAKFYILYNRIFMHPTGYRKPDKYIKLRWLAEARAEGYDPFLVVEDRKQVVEMWRRAGLTCLQCADGDY